MKALYLYNYPLSPFSEKIRLMLGYAGLSWRSIEVPSAPPRPGLHKLTGGYRKIPVAQIGADLFCDSRTISMEIARLAHKPELALPGADPEIQAFVEAADLELFIASMAATISWRALNWHLLSSFGPRPLIAFLKDRAGIARQAKIPRMSRAAAVEKFHAHLADMEGRLQQNFLFGDTPCIADFSAYHSLWQATESFASPITRKYPAVHRWLGRMAGIGHGQAIMARDEEALKVAADSEPRALPTDTVDEALQGAVIDIAPTDYARDAVQGRLVAATEHTLILQRDVSDLGTLHVHFPRQGFVYREAAS